MEIEAEAKPALWEEADRLAKRFVEEATETVAATFDDCYGHRIDPVETEAYDGFIPYTNGGYDGVAYALLSYAFGSGTGPAAVQETIESSLRDAAEEFEREHGVTVEEMDSWEAEELAKWQEPTLPGVDRAPYPPQHELRETLYQMQDSWLSEGGTYFYKVRVLFFAADNWRNDNPGVDMVRLFAYLNTDYEYGRDSISWMAHYPGGKVDQTEDGLHFELPLADFVALGETGIDDLITKAVKSLANL